MSQLDTQPHVTASGILYLVNADENLWMIEGDDGTWYTSPTELHPDLLVDGARVEFVGVVIPGEPVIEGTVVVEIISIDIQG